MADTRRQGRFSEPGERIPLSFRMTPEFKERIDRAAASSGRSVAQEVEMRLVWSLDREEEDSAGLLHLMGLIARRLVPLGPWADDDIALTSVARGIVRLCRRLQAPEDGHVADSGPERIVDELLYDLADTGRDHPGPLTARQRWAEIERSRLGPFGARLIEMREAVKAAAQAMPPREPPAANPEALAAWDAPLAMAGSRDAQVHLPRARLLIERSRDANLDDETRGDVRGRAAALIDWLAKQGTDAETIVALRRDLAGSEPSES